MKKENRASFFVVVAKKKIKIPLMFLFSSFSAAVGLQPRL
jgi:hypothetical protein